jgi:uncharacterized protein (TIGR00369 family)
MERETAIALLDRLHAVQNEFYAGGSGTALEELLAPDVMWTVPGANAIAGTYRGLEEVLGYFGRRRDLAARTFRLERRDVLAGAGEQLAALVDGVATVAGAEQRWSTVGLYDVSDGRVAACWLLPLDQRAFDAIWSDPEAGGRTAPPPGPAQPMSGLDYLRAVGAGALPPPAMATHMGIEGTEVQEGQARFRGTPDEHHLNPAGIVHGGFAATLLDTAIGCAVHSTLPAGVGYATVDLNLTFVGMITPAGGPVLCEGTVVHRGRTLATAEARITRERDGRLLAHATGTCLLLGAA